MQTRSRSIPISAMSDLLRKTFDQLNADWFEGRLASPEIFVTSTARRFARYNEPAPWEVDLGFKASLNVSTAAITGQSTADFIALVMHAMVHIWNSSIMNVQDCSRNGTFHNRYFAIEAQRRGLVVEKNQQAGYGITRPGGKLAQYVGENELFKAWGDFRHIGGSRRIKYICPCCRREILSVVPTEVICAPCMEIMRPHG